MKEEDKTNNCKDCQCNSKPKWLLYCHYMADVIDTLRVVPRIIVALYGYMLWESSIWFMGLENPTATQAAFISTLVGIGAAIFNFYVSATGKKE
jgi:hypothetical protein